MGKGRHGRGMRQQVMVQRKQSVPASHFTNLIHMSAKDAATLSVDIDALRGPEQSFGELMVVFYFHLAEFSKLMDKTTSETRASLSMMISRLSDLADILLAKADQRQSIGVQVDEVLKLMSEAEIADSGMPKRYMAEFKLLVKTYWNFFILPHAAELIPEEKRAIAIRFNHLVFAHFYQSLTGDIASAGSTKSVGLQVEKLYDSIGKAGKLTRVHSLLYISSRSTQCDLSCLQNNKWLDFVIQKSIFAWYQSLPCHYEMARLYLKRLNLNIKLENYLLMRAAVTINTLPTLRDNLSANLRELDLASSDKLLSLCYLILFTLDKFSQAKKMPLRERLLSIKLIVQILEKLFSVYQQFDTDSFLTCIATVPGPFKNLAKNLITLIDALSMGVSIDETNLIAIELPALAEINQVALDICTSLKDEATLLYLCFRQFNKAREERVHALAYFERLPEKKPRSIKAAPTPAATEESKSDSDSEEDADPIAPVMTLTQSVTQFFRPYYAAGMMTESDQLTMKLNEILAFEQVILARAEAPDYIEAVNHLRFLVAEWCAWQFKSVDCCAIFKDARNVKPAKSGYFANKMTLAHRLLKAAVTRYRDVKMPSHRAALYIKKSHARSQFAMLNKAIDGFYQSRKDILAEVKLKRQMGMIRSLPKTPGENPYSSLLFALDNIEQDCDLEAAYELVYEPPLLDITDEPVLDSVTLSSEPVVSEVTPDVIEMASAGAGGSTDVTDMAMERFNPEDARVFFSERMRLIQADIASGSSAATDGTTIFVVGRH